MDRQILIQQFMDAIGACRSIYVDKSIECVLSRGDLDSMQRTEYMDEIEFRFNRLLIKIYVDVAWSDLIWSSGEALIAKKLVEDLLRQPIRDKDVGQALEHLTRIANDESWQSVLEPFMLLDEIAEYRPQLEMELMRVANIIAKIDGKVTDEIIGQLKNIKWQLHQFLVPPREITYGPISGEKKSGSLTGRDSGSFDNVSRQDEAQHRAYSNSYHPEPNQNNSGILVAEPATKPVTESETKKPDLEEVLNELDGLIGIESVKKEVRGLINFLKVQAHRKTAGLPENPISLHMVFEGNPGTGKTTVARILGNVFGAMGILEKGHLVETDRSGLVAEYVGQTAAKTNQIIDSAMGGVLFIDEAYSLEAEGGQDPYGAEALQILLKRAEDERERLIIILAGYQEPMNRMLKSNPGLSSRFARRFSFPDYTPEELCEIFGLLAEKNRYTVSSDVQTQLVEQIGLVSQNKDQHFGNGRLIRNVFETAIRKLADRVVDIETLTPELLTTFECSDIEVG